ncbi:conjugal transfer protein [Streptomyces xiamenensis]|uniref:conjugal transfer protein n=1 Tax=Streptomyces xiamenensis TaxID=408015 RepID=UPI0036F0D6E1
MTWARPQRRAGNKQRGEGVLWDGKIDESQGAAAEPDPSGWKTSSAHLSGITRLVRVGVWVLVASGPVLGLLAFFASSRTVPAVSVPAAVPAASSPVGPAGFAELYVSAYLRAGQGTERDLAPFFSGPVVLSVAPGARTATHSTVIASREAEPGYWSVTVAADVTVQDEEGEATRLGVQYFRVGIQATGSAGAGGTSQSDGELAGYAATSLPAQVAAPTAIESGALAYVSDRGSSNEDPAVAAASGFLTAFLTGTSELDRYTSPDSHHLQAISPVPYTAVTVTGVRDDFAGAGQQTVPADGTELHQLVNVDATDQVGNKVSLSYALTLRARDGRWEVASVDDAPAIRVGSAPSAVPHTEDFGSEADTAPPTDF